MLFYYSDLNFIKQVSALHECAYTLIQRALQKFETKIYKEIKLKIKTSHSNRHSDTHNKLEMAYI